MEKEGTPCNKKGRTRPPSEAEPRNYRNNSLIGKSRRQMSYLVADITKHFCLRDNCFMLSQKEQNTGGP